MIAGPLALGFVTDRGDDRPARVGGGDTEAIAGGAHSLIVATVPFPAISSSLP